MMIKGYLQKALQTAQGQQELAVNLAIEQGELVVVYGNSGVGKTTLLRILAGLAQADAGELYVGNQCWINTAHKVSYTAQQRKVGLVFQDYALFPNMTVLQNLEFAANNQKLIKELLHTTGLEQLKDRKPQTLSGGQQQRVALARALVMQPQLLLLDEPLSALDITMRKQLQQLILKLHKDYNMTTLMVSHDVQEVLKMADKVLFLEAGQPAIYGLPKTVLKAKGITLPILLKGEIVKIEGELIYIQIGEEVNCIQRNMLAAADIEVGRVVTLEVSLINNY